MDEKKAGERKRHAPLGPTAARLCEALEAGSVIAVACGEQRGEAIARAAAALTPVRVLWCPPPDRLPGEATPSSPAIAGRRFAALAALQQCQEPLLFVTDAISAAYKVAPPAAFAAPPLIVRRGDAFDGEKLAGELEAIGYFSDDRVDEPGEYSIRGGALDLFPADAAEPVRIHLEEGCVTRINSYDPVSQLGRDEEMDALAILPAIEPAAGEEAVTIFDHLPGAAAALDPEAIELRDRFISLGSESRGSASEMTGDWKTPLTGRRRIDLAEGEEQEGRRFILDKRPERSSARAIAEARERGDRVLLAGAPRDVRFLSRRLERAIGEAPQPTAAWSHVKAARPGALLTIEAELDRGWTEPGLTIIATPDLLGARALESATGPATTVDPLAQEVADFHLGDAVIQEDHGLGLLRGSAASAPTMPRPMPSGSNMPAKRSGWSRSRKRASSGATARKETPCRSTGSTGRAGRRGAARSTPPSPRRRGSSSRWPRSAPAGPRPCSIRRSRIMSVSPPAFPMARLPTSCARSRRCVTTSPRASRWTGWWWATSATARPRSRFGRRPSPLWPAGRWR
jgi:transcription-repair coupling factor (superfamily II helicase)